MTDTDKAAQVVTHGQASIIRDGHRQILKRDAGGPDG